MDRAAVPTDSELRRIENIFFLEDIREIPGSNPPEELPSTPTTTPHSIIPEGKGRDKEAQPLAKEKLSKDTLTIKDVVAQAKDARPKPKAGDDRQEAEGIAKSSTQDKV